MKTSNEPEYLSVEEVCCRLGVYNPATIQNWIMKRKWTLADVYNVKVKNAKIQRQNELGIIEFPDYGDEPPWHVSTPST